MGISAIGGTVTTYVDGSTEYTVHTFTSSGSFIVNAGSSDIDYLIVAGGGGGGYYGGGGGGGGVLSGSTSVGIGTFTVTVGSGGTRGTGVSRKGVNGGNSSAFSLTALGGGGGGGDDPVLATRTGASGGCGGGGSGYYYNAGGPGGAGTAGQGYAGGDGITTNVTGGAGGGGGSGAVGEVGSTASTLRGNGGVGLVSSITGSAAYYAGGGAGFQAGRSAIGGLGGGGAEDASGTANTGGGGGVNLGTASNGDGGSGIVIIRYVSADISELIYASSYDTNHTFAAVIDSGVPTNHLNLSIAGYPTLTGIVDLAKNGFLSLSFDSFKISVFRTPVLVETSDVISAIDSSTPKLVSVMDDILLASDTVTPSATIRALLDDEIGYGEALAAIVLALSQDGLTLTDTSNGALQQIALMAELLACASGSTASVEIAASLMDLLAAREALSYVQDATMDETLALADNLTAAINALAHSSDFLALTESYQNGMVALVGDSVSVDDMTSPQVEMLLEWRDAILCFTNLPLEDGNYTAWAMNAETTGMSRYTVPALNSLFDHEGRVWGVSETGLWALAGETDDGEPIEAWIKTGHMKLGDGREVNIPRAYLYTRTTGEMLIKTVSSVRGTRTERTYTVQPALAGDDDAARIVPLARGLRGVYWQVEIANVDGADFNIENCEVRPVVLSRRGQ